MAHSKSVLKRIRQSEARRLHRRSIKSSLRTEMKKFATAVTAGEADQAAVAFKAVQKSLDKTASKKIIPKGRADRVKARLAARLNAAKAAKAAKKA